MESFADKRVLKLRSVFVSDVHLGSRGCRADLLLDFLRSIEVETLYLVGDIVDLWAMRRGFYWPQEHNNALRTLLGKAKAGTRLIYIPGNHDEDIREFAGAVFGNLEIHRECVHRTAGGERYLVIHGDEFDAAVKCSRWLSALGSMAYDCTLALNRLFNRVRRLYGFPYWSLAGYLKHRVKNAMHYVAAFERSAALAARRRGLDGVICGHIHRAEIVRIADVTYCNDGDWVESCTALAEDLNGKLSLIQWPDLVSQRVSVLRPKRVA